MEDDYYISKLLKACPTKLLIIKEETSFGVRIRESKYPGCTKGAERSSRGLVHELVVPSYGPLCL